MASKKNKSLTNKLDEIKRMQSNWLQQRNAEKEQKTQKSSHPATSDQNRNSAPRKKNVHNSSSDNLSWIVGSGQKKKSATPNTLRARSASPARKSNSSSSLDKKTNQSLRPSNGKDSARSTGSTRSSGSTSSRSRPPSGRTEKSNIHPHEYSDILKKSSSESNLESSTQRLLNMESSLSSDHGDNQILSTESSLKVERDFSSEVSGERTSGIENGGGNRIQNLSLHRNPREYHMDKISTNDLIGPDAFDRLADEIAKKVRTDLDDERRKILTDAGLNRDSILLEEEGAGPAGQSSHVCSKCKQMMTPPDHTPTMLVPCGHTFCEPCAEDRIKCPTCRTKVESTAINETLQHVILQTRGKSHHPSLTKNETLKQNHLPLKIHSSNENQRTSGSKPYIPGNYCEYDSQSTRLNNSSGNPIVSSSKETLNYNQAGKISSTFSRPKRHLSVAEQGERYANEFQSLSIRCEAYENEEEEILQRMEKNKRDVGQQRKQISNIEKEKQRIQEEIKKLEEKAAILDSHQTEFSHRCEELEEIHQEEEDKLTMVRDSLQSLQRQKEKVKLLARNFNVSLD